MNLLGIGILAALIAVPASPTTQPAKTPDRPADSPELQKVCAERSCRTGGYEAVVSVDKDRYTTIPVTHSPYLVDTSSVLIFPGETVAIQFSLDGDKLGPPVSVMRYAPRLPVLIVKAGAPPEINPEDAALPIIKESMPAEEVRELPPNTLLVSYGSSPRGELEWL